MSERDRRPLWGGRFASSPAEAFERLNASIPFDIRLAPYDIEGSVAHARMLGETGIVAGEESEELVRGLRTVLEEVESGRFSWTLSDEDVHTAVERRLREVVGDVALKLHTGRSRNDQVALDLHLFVGDAAERIKEGLLEAMRALVEVAGTHWDLVLPGYTHLQRAQPILLAHHLLAHFWAFERDLKRLDAAREAANVSPLGAAALGGTPHSVDSALTAELLGMQPLVNSLDAVSERDFALDLLYACAVLGVHLSRLGEEWVLWTSAEFGFATLDDAYSSGSSIMPQKKNPDAYELMRGKAGRLIGNLNALLVTLKGLPLGYSKDLQEDKEPFFDSVDSILSVLAVLPEMLRTASFDGTRMKDAAGGFALATELADFLAARGVP
ncbi:MAG: argininosuccinate lyase, partial [Actinobacteria bacterium]|nr:argininosuccinate lyase [Actinomycetota bacterium]